MADVVPVGEGIVNTVYHVAFDGADTAYALRLHVDDAAGFARECELLSRLEPVLPVPHVVLADATCSRCEHPYIVYRWIDGMTLNECRRHHSPDALLAHPLGELLARIAAVDDPGARRRAIRITERLEVANRQLRASPARDRIGGALADALGERLTKHSPRLLALDGAAGLVHGDFGGRNILVRQDDRGQWEISGVLDWENATTGSRLWDIGSLFRYPKRYSPEFRDRFANGYRAVGGDLPDDWWHAARLLDATRLVATLDEDRDIPGVFAECRELIEWLTFHDSDTSAL